MARVLVAACAVVLTSVSLQAAEPKPLWELPVTVGGEQAAAPAWFSYSPDGRAIVAVSVRATATETPEYTFHLRVWDAASRKERFNSALGTSKSFHWGDDLAAFPTDDTLLTGGQMMTVRSLENGSQTQSQPTGGLADHAVWAVPDLKESFFLRRDSQRYNLPIELFFKSQNNINQFNEFGGRGGRGIRPDTGTQQTTLDPPRQGMRAEVVALNAGRTHLVATFRDEPTRTETATSRPRHSLAIYRIKTVADFDLELVSEVTNPHAGPVASVAFARNGRILATGGDDGSINLWRLTAGGLSKPQSVAPGAVEHRVYAMAFSNDWRYLAAVTWDKAKPNLLIIDVDSGRLVRAIRQERQLTTLAWSPDGRTLLTGGASGTIRAWDAAALVKGN